MLSAISLLDLAWRLSRPLLFSLDAERAHRLVLKLLHGAPGLSRRLLSLSVPEPGPQLQAQLGPIRLRSPIGLAAGLDKDGEAISVWPALGFGFVEVGTVTPRPQPGNPKPRMFRLVPERGIINRMGFNNGGLDALRTRILDLRAAGRWPDIPVGANLGKNKDTPNEEAERDYLACVEGLTGLVDYFTINVSSPNTPGLRELQEADRLSRLLEAVIRAARSTPVFLKLAPDLEPQALREAVDVALGAGCLGIIATNTTITRPGTTARLDEAGGLSGDPLWPLARERIEQVLSAVDGRGPVIGVGGVSSPDRAQCLLEMGCAAVQLYSGLVFEGPGLPGRILRHLNHRLPVLEHRPQISGGSPS